MRWLQLRLSEWMRQKIKREESDPDMRQHTQALNPQCSHTVSQIKLPAMCTRRSELITLLEF